MNRELQLKLQAFLDGELSEREARRVSDWIEADAEAKAMLAELRWTKAILADAEPERVLPESADFFWSKIEREISRVESASEPARERSWLRGWQRVLAPAGGLALVVLLGLVGLKSFTPSAEAYLAEVETPSEHVGAYSFRSQRDNIFVVWVYERLPESEPQLEWNDSTL